MFCETLGEKDEKCERFFDKVEKKLTGFAQRTDHAIAQINVSAATFDSPLETLAQSEFRLTEIIIPLEGIEIPEYNELKPS